jgi:hypothetical protein
LERQGWIKAEWGHLDRKGQFAIEHAVVAHESLSAAQHILTYAYKRRKTCLAHESPLLVQMQHSKTKVQTLQTFLRGLIALIIKDRKHRTSPEMRILN